jgi:DME family drug/metabolite transporter
MMGTLSSRPVPAPSRPAPLRGLVLIGLAAMSWGTTGSVTTVLIARDGTHPLVIGAARMVLAAVVLLAGARALTGPLRIAREDRWRCVAMGLSMAVFQAAYFTAVSMTGIAVAALIAICSAPLMIAALAAAFLGERLTVRVGTALAVGIAGTALLIVGPRSGADVSARFAGGAALALLAGFAYALSVVITKAALARTPPLSLSAVSFAVGALAFAPALATPEAVRQLAAGWLWLLYLGVVTTGAAYALYTIGLRHVSASVAAVVALLEPLTATLLGVLLFGERLGAVGAAGAVLLLGALVLLSVPARVGAAPAPP